MTGQEGMQSSWPREEACRRPGKGTGAGGDLERGCLCFPVPHLQCLLQVLPILSFMPTTHLPDRHTRHGAPRPHILSTACPPPCSTGHVSHEPRLR